MSQTMFWVLVVVLVAWTLAWKGPALWKSARNNQPGWFIAFLFLNLLGLLEMIYLFFFQRDRNKK
jgi:hypothetical protein